MIRRWRMRRTEQGDAKPTQPHMHHEWEAIVDPSYLGVGAVIAYRCTGCPILRVWQ